MVLFFFFFDSLKLLHSDDNLFGIFKEMQLMGEGGASLRSESISNILLGRQINRQSSTCLCATRGKKTVGSLCSLKHLCQEPHLVVTVYTWKPPSHTANCTYH